MNIRLTYIEFAILALFVLAIWTVYSSSNVMRTMGQAGNPGTPQAALGQAAINGTIGCLTILVVGLALSGAGYLYVRRPSLFLPTFSVTLFAPAPAPAPTACPCPPLASGGQAEVVVETGIVMYEADAAGKPTDRYKAHLWPEQRLTVVAGPGELNGRLMWQVRTPDGVEGWVPALTPGGSVALAPR